MISPPCIVTDNVVSAARFQRSAPEPYPRTAPVSSFEQGQRPSHGLRCDHQYDRGCEHQTQQTEEEHTLAHVGALTEAKVEAGKPDKLTSWTQPWRTS